MREKMGHQPTLKSLIRTNLMIAGAASSLCFIFLLIAKRTYCSSYDIKSNFKIRHPSYLRYMKYLRKWDWVQYAPGRKKEIFMLSKKGAEILNKVFAE